MGAFDGQSVVVTGAGSGLGEDAARAFAAAGARVTCVDIDADAAARVAAGTGGLALACDVGDPAQVQAALARAAEAHGGLDVLVASAGICLLAPLPQLEPEAFARMLHVNVVGVLNGIRAATPLMAAAGGGAIVNVASTAGLNGAPLIGGYGATKAAVVSLTRTAAVELRPAGIRVNCVCPGFVDTPMSAGLVPGFEAASGASAADFFVAKQGRLGEPADVTRAILHLAEPGASWVTGTSYVVDGGLTAALM